MFLTVLMFTTVFSQEQTSAARAGNAAIEADAPTAAGNPAPDRKSVAVQAGNASVASAAAGNPAPDRKSAAAPVDAAGASPQQNEKPTNYSELTAYVRESMKEHPVLTNLCLLGALIVIVLITLAIRQIFLYGLKAVFQKIPMQNPEYKKQMGISKNSIGWIFSVWANRTMQEDLSVAT